MTTTKLFTNREDATTGAKFGFDVTPSATAFTQHTRAVTVSIDGATITGELIDRPGVSFTTHPLAVGILHPYWFIKITAVSTGTVKGYY